MAKKASRVRAGDHSVVQDDEDFSDSGDDITASNVWVSTVEADWTEKLQIVKLSTNWHSSQLFSIH